VASMKRVEVARYWEANAETWTRHARAGYDIYRDRLNTPAFLDMLPPVRGLSGLDIGCGEGSSTRELVRRGARMHVIDVARPSSDTRAMLRAPSRSASPMLWPTRRICRSPQARSILRQLSCR
jgi:2-polyprenyl-3-methyl-5-hydroxy-6-metoxy-1,4-benzoquinol methylase